MPKITQITMLTHNIMELRLEKPADFEYLAGQFVQFEVPQGDKMVKRSYSLASTPYDSELHFCIKILDPSLNGPASAHLPTLAVGDEVTIGPVRGRFVVHEDTPLVCVATGAGMAPIMGIIRDELETKKNTHPIHVLFGVRHETDVFWQEHLDALDKHFENFSYAVTLSRPDESWNGHKGRVTDHIKTIDNAKYYMCGSPDMVKEVRNILLNQKIDPRAIHFEIF